jgi:hypothetical protein
MKKKVMYFLINDQFGYQKINKHFFRSSWFKNIVFLESLISIPRKKQKTTKIENFDEKRSRSPKNNLKSPFEHFRSGRLKFSANGLVMIILQMTKTIILITAFVT